MKLFTFSSLLIHRPDAVVVLFLYLLQFDFIIMMVQFSSVLFNFIHTALFIIDIDTKQLVRKSGYKILTDP